MAHGSSRIKWENKRKVTICQPQEDGMCHNGSRAIRVHIYSGGFSQDSHHPMHLLVLYFHFFMYYCHYLLLLLVFCHKDYTRFALRFCNFFPKKEHCVLCLTLFLSDRFLNKMIYQIQKYKKLYNEFPHHLKPQSHSSEFFFTHLYLTYK